MSARISFARTISSRGTPARRATWMPYERSVPPSTILCRNTISSFHSRIATLMLHTPFKRVARSAS
jgi:hypothetical protein